MKDVAFWISTENYHEEAARSAVDLATHMPNVARVLFSPDQYRGSEFTHSVLLPPEMGPYWYMDSIKYFNIAFDALGGFDRLMYLDSDVNVIAPIPELFDMLPRFDVVGVMGSRRITGAVHGDLPQAFPEFEIGVTLFRTNERVKRLFEKWLELHKSHPDIYGNNDQRSFREALWLCEDLKIGTVPCEYGLRWPFGVFMSLPVKVLHGRPLGPAYPDSPTLDDVKRIVNEHYDMRIWSPRSDRWRDGVIPPDYD